MCWICHRFVLENSVLDKYVRYILTIYPSVIWAVTGVFTKNYDAANPTRNNIFIGEELKHLDQNRKWNLFTSSTCNETQMVCTLIHPSGIFFPLAALLASACALFVARIVLVTWRNFNRPFYKDVSPDDMSPMEIAEKQKRIFKWKCRVDVFLLK